MDDVSYLTAAKIFWRVAPTAIKTTILHSLSLSSTSGKQDLRTALTVAIIRHLINQPSTITQTQTLGLRDPGIKSDRITVVDLPAPSEPDSLNHVLQAIQGLTPPNTRTTPPLNLTYAPDLTAEWTVPPPDTPPTKTTILYFHGGGYFTMSPASHRPISSTLSRQTPANVLSVRYRLAPQHPFPNALLDAFVAYLTLLSPPIPTNTNSILPAPIPSTSIILAGDSAGGGLALSLLLLLLQLRRRSTSPSYTTNPINLHFHSRVFSQIPLPAGVAVNSPHLDCLHLLPSVHRNAKFDYLMPPPPSTPTTSTPSATTSTSTTTDASGQETAELPTGTLFEPLPDTVWPATPPRVDLYAPHAHLLRHPLVSPAFATHEQWAGVGRVPVWACVGEEMLTDAGLVMARAVGRSGVDGEANGEEKQGRVLVEGWEGMPHCFAMVFPQSEAGKGCVARWSGFCRWATSSGVVEQEEGNAAVKEGTQVVWHKRNGAGKWVGEEVDVDEVLGVSEEEVGGRVERVTQRMVEKEEKMVKEWDEEGGGKAKL